MCIRDRTDTVRGEIARARQDANSANAGSSAQDSPRQAEYPRLLNSGADAVLALARTALSRMAKTTSMWHLAWSVCST
eukprot:7905130-Alexandrium_andersonii.AAC.1